MRHRRKATILSAEKLRVEIKIDVLLRAKIFHRFEEAAIALISQAQIAARGTLRMSRAAHIVEVVHFLERRHPEIVMPIQLLEEPGCSGFLRADAKEVRFCIGIDGSAVS